jgi:4-amino-4-deoxy-L-arabinose transferase
MIQRSHYIFIILLFFTLVYLLPLGVRPLFVPDETRYAEIPREMVASGDWVQPRFNGLKYYEKPIMGYWVHGLSQMAMGESNFAVRLPSALSTGLVAFLIFYMLAGVIGSRDSRGYIAPLIFLSSFGVMGIGTVPILDNLLNLFVTASIVLFFLASEKERSSVAEKLLLILAGLAVGCAFMTKGFLAFVVPVITVIPYLLWQRRAGDLFRMLWLPALAAVMVSLPWSIMIHLRDPDFWNVFFWHEHVKRFFYDTAQHKEPFWFYLVAIIPLFLPWILLLPSACSGLFNRDHRGQKISNILAFSTCWFVFPLLFFSISNGKLVTYILPCLPPLAILTAIGLYGSLKGVGRFLSSGLALYILLISLVFSGFIATQLFSLDIVSLPENIWKYNAESLQYSEAWWKPVLIAASLAVMAVICFLALRSENREKKLVLLALSPVLLMISLCFALPDLTLTVKAPGTFLKKEAENIPDDAVILADSTIVGAACWFLKRDDLFLIQWGGELGYGLKQEESKHRVLYYPAILKLIEEKQDGMIVLILETDRWERYFADFPEPRYFASTGPYGYTVVKY